MSSRLVNPLWSFIFDKTGKSVPFTQMEKYADINSATVRAHTMSYVQDRIAGRRRSTVGQQSDMLSLFLSADRSVLTDETIVDELIDFNVAGTQSTQMVS